MHANKRELVMLWPKKNSCKEFDNEKKNSSISKIPLPPPPHNFSNGPSLTNHETENDNNNRRVTLTLKWAPNQVNRCEINNG